MVEVMRIPSQGQYPSDTLEMDMREMSSRLMTTTLDSIEEELKKDTKGEEGSKNGGLHVPPRRAFTTSDYLIPTAPVSLATTPSSSPREASFALSVTHRPAPTTGSSPRLSPTPPAPSGSIHWAATQRPSAQTGLPHRSYSVMDYEPIPFTHRPGTALRLGDLPAELHYALFDFLDPIDSVCLALTSRRFYAVHWSMHGRVSLAARREGPNDMEWVWRHAGPFLLRRGGDGGGGGGGAGKQNALAMLSPRGQVYCRRCRTARCELHKHIKDWMGPGLEYCAVTEKYGPAAPEGAKGFCFRSSPKHPNRCGRHTRNQRAVRLV
ncbi:putative F-box domain-containing protein [Rosellinia necatrix]|uniref:Putative F-box domain-containing protein n=1 Tax=Rosellinia necatrix TaxID=77044 RepID=A0A1S7UMD3_ROSNE|nr:putative F-box domain-containing protein [Rosellinia necatrix]